jgi:hypothetical protein
MEIMLVLRREETSRFPGMRRGEQTDNANIKRQGEETVGGRGKTTEYNLIKRMKYASKNKLVKSRIKRSRFKGNQRRRGIKPRLHQAERGRDDKG